MSFPTINTKATNLDLTPELAHLLDQKLAPLENFIPAHETDVVCDVELEKLTEHQSGRIYRAEINLQVSGKLFRAEAIEEQIELAIDEMKSNVKRELRKHHSRTRSLMRNGGRKLKEMFRRGK